MLFVDFLSLCLYSVRHVFSTIQCFCFCLFQFSDFLQSYNKLSEICFADCVNDFTSREVKTSEVSIFVARTPISQHRHHRLIFVLGGICSLRFSLYLQTGLMCAELYGKILENEPANIATFPGISDASQWKCNCHGAKGWKIINHTIVMRKTQIKTTCSTIC